jgi:hypothetical protein
MCVAVASHVARAEQGLSIPAVQPPLRAVHSHRQQETRVQLWDAARGKQSAKAVQLARQPAATLRAAH